eukprot:5086908-Pleurochrysis_carterae.AAC.1
MPDMPEAPSNRASPEPHAVDPGKVIANNLSSKRVIGLGNDNAEPVAAAGETPFTDEESATRTRVAPFLSHDAQSPTGVCPG